MVLLHWADVRRCAPPPTTAPGNNRLDRWVDSRAPQALQVSGRTVVAYLRESPMLRREIGRGFARILVIGVAVLTCCAWVGAAEVGEFTVAPGFRMEPGGAATLKPLAFAWDDSGRLYVLEPRPGAEGGAARPVLKRVGSFDPGGIANDVREIAADLPESTSIVVFRDDVYVGIAGGILHLGKDGPRATHALPVGEFPAGAVVHGLRWGPDLRVYFCFAGA